MVIERKIVEKKNLERKRVMREKEDLKNKENNESIIQQYIS